MPALNVKVDPLPAVTVDGDTDAIAPAGVPLTLSATDCAAPLVTAELPNVDRRSACQRR